MTDLRRAYVIVEGRVQGVFFRASTRDFARGLGLTGWVRNRRDGNVEAVFEGPPEEVSKAVAFVRNGPPQAFVTNVELEQEDIAESEFMTFRILEDADE